MKAGRELDALVAEKVMGWVWIKEINSPRAPELLPPNGHSPVMADDPIPRFSTDIAAAWSVIEKLSGPDEYATYQITNAGAAGDVFVCVGKGEAFAETLPLAICLAAIHAVEN